MKLLCIADLHELTKSNLNRLKNINDDDFDVVILLGDNCKEILQFISETWNNYKPVFGILGNHDYYDILNDHYIANAHGEVVSLQGTMFSGIQGSYKYKNIKDIPMYTQGESFAITSRLPKIDILISHTSPYGVHEQDEDVHLGFFGISEYIERCNPKLNIHGHQHINKTTVLENGTVVIGVYGAVIIDIKNGTKDTIINLK